ncbi:hypothetical protein V8C35DRAFT_135983 [Trichoderma chlorosporum]
MSCTMPARPFSHQKGFGSSVLVQMWLFFWALRANCDGASLGRTSPNHPISRHMSHTSRQPKSKWDLTWIEFLMSVIGSPLHVSCRFLAFRFCTCNPKVSGIEVNHITNSMSCSQAKTTTRAVTLQLDRFQHHSIISSFFFPSSRLEHSYDMISHGVPVLDPSRRLPTRSSFRPHAKALFWWFVLFTQFSGSFSKFLCVDLYT